MDSRSSEFALLYCSICGYEEELHYKEIERRSLKCPECGAYIDYTQTTAEDVWDYFSEDEVDDLLGNI